MKIEIEIPDFMPVDFSPRNPQLGELISQLCIFAFELSRFKTAKKRKLFYGYVRNGVKTLYNSNEDITVALRTYQELKKSAEEEAEFADIKEDYLGADYCWPDDDEPADNSCVVDEDLPGKWVLARFCFPRRHTVNSLMSITLYSTDFENDAERAKAILTKCVKAVASHCHTTPQTSQQLQNAINALRTTG